MNIKRTILIIITCLSKYKKTKKIYTSLVKTEKMMCIFFYGVFGKKQEFYNLQIKLQLNKRCAQKIKKLN